MRFSWVKCPSCHPTISVKAVNGAKSSNLNQWPGIMLSSTITGLLVEKVLLPSCQLTDTSTVQSKFSNAHKILMQRRAWRQSEAQETLKIARQKTHSSHHSLNMFSQVSLIIRPQQQIIQIITKTVTPIYWFGEGKGIQLIKTCATYPEGSLPEEISRKKAVGNQLTQVHQENGC